MEPLTIQDGHEDTLTLEQVDRDILRLGLSWKDDELIILLNRERATLLRDRLDSFVNKK